MNSYPKPPFNAQQQPVPGEQRKMDPMPDCGEQSYQGSGRLANKIALVTGADSGIGRAVAIAFAREGADVAVSYLDEHEDAKETARWVEAAGRQCLLLPGDLGDAAQCTAIVNDTVEKFGRIDVLVNNAAFQMTYQSLEDIPDEDWVKTFNVNIVSTMTPDMVKNFGGNTPLGRPGQPVEVAPIYVLLASDEGSYISGERYGVTGGKPIL